MSRRLICIHEAGHAVVGHAIGLRVGSNGITTVTSKKTGNAGATSFHSLQGTNETFFALTLAGPMAEGLATTMDTLDMSEIGHGWGKDIDDLCWVLCTGGCERPRDALYPDAMPRRDSPPKHFSLDIDTLNADVHRIVFQLALTLGAEGLDTEDAFEDLGDETPSAHFLALAKAAETAREVLNRKWGTVIALAEHLMKVRKMSGEQLVTFLNETNAVEAGTATPEQVAMAAGR